MNNKKILLIITGSVACYKSIELIRLLKKNSYEVNCILSKGAQEFITPLLVSAVSQTKTYYELFSTEDEINMGHINLSRSNDLIVIAPTTADFIAKIANGYADDLASSAVLASDKKIILAPAMNEKMWNNAITQNNIDKILQNGVMMIEPENDILACGEEGIGKMANIEKIVEKIDNYFLNQNSLKNKNILITAGGTLEPIDPVRFIGNNSSGKQALLIAKTLTEMGANISLIVGNISHKIDFCCENIFHVKTAQQMFDKTFELINSQGNFDVFIGCSAVADYRVKNYSPQKIKKSLYENPIIELEKNPDILDCVGNYQKRPHFVVGFCAESENLIANAKEKLLRKNCDLIVANHIENGKIFGSDYTCGALLGKDFCENFENISKVELAKKLSQMLIKNPL